MVIFYTHIPLRYKRRLTCIAEAHHAQTSLLTKEASGEDLAYSVTMMHGQDHLMTTVLLKDLMHHLIELYKRGVK